MYLFLMGSIFMKPRQGENYARTAGMSDNRYRGNFIFYLYMRFHPFLALIASALIITFSSDRIPMITVSETGALIPQKIATVTNGFGALMANIGVLLIMAAIIGKCLMDSGAADRIVRALRRCLCGNEQYSLLSSSFLLAIPVFLIMCFTCLHHWHGRCMHAGSGIMCC